MGDSWRFFRRRRTLGTLHKIFIQKFSKNIKKDTMNSASEIEVQATKKMVSPVREPDSTCGNGVSSNGDVLNDDDFEEERLELESELQDLAEDKTYHDFITNVVSHKEIVEEDESTDPAFVAPDSGRATGEEGAVEVSDVSTLTDEDEDDEEDDNGEEIADIEDGSDIKIPKEALEDAKKRFPAYWRFKHAMKTEYREGDYKEDEDADYKPEEDVEAVDLNDTQDEELEEEEEDDGAAATAAGAEDGEAWRGQDAEVDSEDDDKDEDAELEESELDVLKAEQGKDLKTEVDGLVEMVEYMTVVTEDGKTVSAAPQDVSNSEAVEDEDEEGMEEDEGEDQPEQTILELDVDGYVSGEDPDFKPEKEMLDAASESDDTDDEDLNKSGVERME